MPTAAARRALLGRGGSGLQKPGRWAGECGEYRPKGRVWASGSPPSRAGEVGYGPLLTFSALSHHYARNAASVT